jgi:HEAT repeat protein
VRWVVLLPPLLFHLLLGLALRALASRTGVGPGAWAWAPVLNLVLLLRIAGRSPAWAFGLVVPGVNAVVWALVWAEIGARVGRRGLWLWMSLPGPNMYVLGRLAGLGARRAGVAAAVLAASVAAAWAAHESLTRAHVAALTEQLAAPDAATRRWAARRLAEWGPRARAEWPALKGALADAEPAVRGEAARAMWVLAPDAAAVDAAATPEPLLAAARGSAAWPLPDAALVAGLAAAGAGSPPLLEAALRDDDAGIRWHAAAAFVHLGRRAAGSAAALFAAMHDPEWNVRNSAGRALEEVAGPEHAALLSAALVEPNVETRYHVARALARLGPRASPALPALLETLADEDWEVRMESCWTLAAIGPSARTAQDALLRTLRDPDPQVRAAAAWGLAQIGAGPEVAGPLRALLDDPVRDVRTAAADALRRVEGRS